MIMNISVCSKYFSNLIFSQDSLKISMALQTMRALNNLTIIILTSFNTVTVKKNLSQ